MGNLSKKAKAKVNVTLDTSIILQGDILNGKITIEPNKNSNVTKLQNPKISIGIFQQQNWQSFIFSEEDKKSRNGELNSNIYSNQTLNCSQYKDKNFSEGITIPFQYKIPEDITPSFEWPHTRYEFASIRNFLSVNIPELSYKKQILLIILKRPDPIGYPLKETKIEERKKLLLFGAGPIKVEGSYPKSSYPILGNIPLTVKVDASKSNVLIKEVTVKLKRKLQFYNKNNSKILRSILQNMYEETKSLCNKSEDLLFNIPFKDSNKIEYYMKSSPLGENTEICCLIPNVSTNTINVIYYIKVIAVPDDILAKNIELKMSVDFHSKDENQINRNIYDNFNNQVQKINSGEININNMEPYLQYQFNNNDDKRLSQSVYNHQYSLNTQSAFNLNPNPIQNQNYNQNNYNPNIFQNNYIPRSQNLEGYQNNNNFEPNYQNMNNNMNKINQNINNNLNNNINFQNENNNQNSIQLPSVPEYNQNEGPDLPTLHEIEEQNNENKKDEQLMNNAYPTI